MNTDRTKPWHDLSNWTMPGLHYELAYQTREGIHAVEEGVCGHVSRGPYCAGCLRREIARREAA